MNIDAQTLDKIAHLARLEVKPQESQNLINSLESVLSWMEQLNEVDTTGIAPLTHISQENNRWRDDIAQNTLKREEALENAPSKTEQYIRVPKVIE
ncbi:aspartyl-tRNA(Asn)/glutamyl-tRNA(Gln) amidotransferase subunit C [Dyadobacter jejuensis]|uniref:Aspartyl/glutamyl-tRNA(Asn/Gln) amidotransferase subunit C n=1 Tax=Dyadobacter jejuensis TaxID=1082580 RepID=A0A316AT23_9BACT|nr:Asp-tRNA(Asn)/Glu-tRNA(Gln) amidotransferase subunit GatC [Dyadobacter jejuensis]PWJ59960.1 aspartyl-tRNA(Asn)/glutamyl-tRNA(Gln) amidotransferase subunit C [Dyadobacter jejuensis]